MTWLGRLDRLIAAGHYARREESALLLDELLSLPIRERWTCMLQRDARLTRLTDLDHRLFIRSLAVNAMLIQGRHPEENDRWSEREEDVIEPASANAGAFGGAEGLFPGGYQPSLTYRHAEGGAAPRTGRGAWVFSVGAVLAVAISNFAVLHAMLPPQDGPEAVRTERPAELQAELQAVSARLAATESKLAESMGMASVRMATLMTAGELRVAVDLGLPFDRPLQRFQVAAAAGAPPEVGALLADLGTRAYSGVPNLAQLTAEFDDIARSFFDPRQNRSPMSVFGQAIGGIASGVTGILDGSSWQQAAARPLGEVLANARWALERQALPEAIAALTGLRGPAAARLAPWVASAEARVAADRSLAALEAALKTVR